MESAPREELRRVAVPAAEVGDGGAGGDAFQQALRPGLDLSARGGKGPGKGLIEFPIEGHKAAGDDGFHNR
jgi:hypothetical protein